MAGSGPDATPMTAFHLVTAQTPRGWRTVAHPKAREKPLKPFGWLDRQAERIVDARPELLRCGKSSRAREAWPPERPCPASAERTSPAASIRAGARKRVEDADAAR